MSFDKLRKYTVPKDIKEIQHSPPPPSLTMSTEGKKKYGAKTAWDH